VCSALGLLSGDFFLSRRRRRCHCHRRHRRHCRGRRRRCRRQLPLEAATVKAEEETFLGA